MKSKCSECKNSCLGLRGKTRLISVIPDLNQGEISLCCRILDVLKYQPTVCNCGQEVPLEVYVACICEESEIAESYHIFVWRSPQAWCNVFDPSRASTSCIRPTMEGLRLCQCQKEVGACAVYWRACPPLLELRRAAATPSLFAGNLPLIFSAVQSVS